MRFRMLTALSFAALIVTSAAQAATRIDDPVKFVKSIYTIVANKPAPEDIYTPRLDALFKLDTKEAGGEVGRIDFSFWMNAQDGTISNVVVTKAAVENAPNRLVVIAKFKNEKTPNELHFYFEKTPAGWKLDDARSLLGTQWTLSLILKYGWDGQP